MDIKIFEELGSTNDYLKNNKELLKENFLAVYAKKQISGRGRNENKWFCGDNLDLAFSFVYQPEIVISQIPVITLLTGLSVYKTLFKILNGPSELKIKWPNDILYSDKKLCGILCERISFDEHKNCIIVGIGINVNSVKFPALLNNQAISLKQITKKEFELFSLLDEITNNIQTFFQKLPDKGINEDLRFEILEASHSIGKYVQFSDENIVLKGIITDIAPDGCLVVEEDLTKKRYKVLEASFI